uniref:Serpentine receptor class gamma n=1 Tax=Caenorhabditis tropicalis TaxID=1561998 RepID=A0A1I7UGT8_9PELO
MNHCRFAKSIAQIFMVLNRMSCVLVPADYEQSIFIFTALGFTIICTSITLYKLIVLPDRIKSAEKSLCITSILISICFLLVGACQNRCSHDPDQPATPKLDNSQMEEGDHKWACIGFRSAAE